MGTRLGREWVYAQIQREPLDATPGERAVYSDLGFMLLGALVERLSGHTLDDYCQQHIFAPLGLHATAFVILDKPSPGFASCAATERCAWRADGWCVGRSHDENAYAMGGVTGHAGVFSNLDDVDPLGRLSGGLLPRPARFPARRPAPRVLAARRTRTRFEPGAGLG